MRTYVPVSPQLSIVIVGSEHTATLNYQLTGAAHVHFKAVSFCSLSLTSCSDPERIAIVTR